MFETTREALERIEEIMTDLESIAKDETKRPEHGPNALGEVASSVWDILYTRDATLENTLADCVRTYTPRIDSTLEAYPWLVCERDGEILGYAYASRLRKRRAYQWTVELSVYVAESARGAGVGRGLYESLFAVLEHQGIYDAYAVTTMPNPETEAFHERLGFERLVDFPAMGHSNGEWRDVAWWRRPLSEKPAEPEPITPFDELRETAGLEELLAVGEKTLQL